VHIDNQPFKLIYKQQGQKQWRLMSHWNATLLPITLSPGLGCLLGTCRIQIWS